MAGRAIRLLAAIAGRGDESATSAVTALTDRLDACWAADDRFVAELTRPADDLDAWLRAASAHRAACLELIRSATTALLAATGGGGMDLGHPAQRLGREALFYVIQAQTADGRTATLDAVAR